jgi:phage terminase small subunit
MRELKQEIEKPLQPRAKLAVLEQLKFDIENIIEEDILAAQGVSDGQELSTEQLIDSQAAYMLAYRPNHAVFRVSRRIPRGQ